jgi:preprotein translocase subunit SecE
MAVEATEKSVHMTNPFLKARDFVVEVWAELKKSSWPTRQELVDSTIVVIVTVLILGVFVALADMVFLRIIAFLTRT